VVDPVVGPLGFEVRGRDSADFLERDQEYIVVEGALANGGEDDICAGYAEGDRRLLVVTFEVV
jgi:hypothetical protein